MNAIGVQTGQANTNISSSNFTPSVLGAINETGTLTPQPEQQMTSTPPPSSGVSSQPAASGENTKTMSVTFDILNNPVSRGSDQNITITVSDALQMKAFQVRL